MLSKNNSNERAPVVAVSNLPQRKFNFKRTHHLVESNSSETNSTTAQITPNETSSHASLIETAQTSSVEIAQITSDETAPEPKRHCIDINEIVNWF